MTNKFIYTTAIDKIRKLNKRYRVIQGGSSAGKTYAIVAVLIDYATKHPYKKIDIVSMTYEHLSSGAIQDFKDIMQATNRWREAGWHDTRHQYTFANGSFIRFKAIDKEAKAKGPRRDVLYVNEANHIDYPIFNQLAIRTNDHIFLDFNPTRKFWAHDEIISENDANYIILNYKDNEALNDNIIKDFNKRREQALTSSYWANWCKVYVDGETGKLDGVIFDNWKTIDSIPSHPTTGATIQGCGLDFGFTNDQTAAIAIYKWNGDIILDEVIYEKGLVNSEIAKRLTDNNLKGKIVIADAAEPKSIYELGSYGHKVVPAQKGADSVNYGIQILQDYNIFITSRSKNLIQEFENYSWLKDANGMPTNKPEDKNNHGIDAVRYFVSMLMPKATTANFKVIRR